MGVSVDEGLPRLGVNTLALKPGIEDGRGTVARICTAADSPNFLNKFAVLIYKRIVRIFV